MGAGHALPDAGKFHRGYARPDARDRPFSCRRAISSSSTVMAAIAACWRISCATSRTTPRSMPASSILSISASEKSAAPDVHGGKSETSVMMALAPRLVRRDKLARMRMRADKDAIEALVFERGTTWPWRSDDPRLGDQGVIGDARGRLGRARTADRRRHDRAIPPCVRAVCGTTGRDRGPAGLLSAQPPRRHRRKRRHGAGQHRQYAPVGVAEVRRHARHEKSHDVDGGRGRDADGEGAFRASRASARRRRRRRSRARATSRAGTISSVR